jgi:hypothetical protein
MKTKYTSKAFFEVDNTEYVFVGRGWSTAASYWDPSDQEMTIDGCERYIYAEYEGKVVQESANKHFDIDEAIKHIATSQGTSDDDAADTIIQQLWDNAEADDFDDEGFAWDE